MRGRPTPPARRRRVLARLATLGVLAGTVVAGSGAPAEAHGVGGIEATNYETTVRRAVPAIAGIEVRAVDNGERLKASNRTRHDLVILGYDAEPYLRLGPQGAFENRRSPAVTLNRSFTPSGRLPASADPDAAPEWRRIGTEAVVRWHDHRAHWMGDTRPPAVARDPGSEHLVSHFTVEARWRGQDLRVVGDLRWIPAPSPWPWILLAVAVGVLVPLLARRRTTPVVVAALAVAVVSAVVVEIGRVGGSTEAAVHKLAAAAYTMAGLVVAAVALVAMLRQGLPRAAPLALLAGVFLAVGTGLASVTWITHSQLPTELPAGIVRAAIALAFGAGGGVAVAAGWNLAAMPPGTGSNPRRRTTGDTEPSALREAFERRTRVG